MSKLGSFRKLSILLSVSLTYMGVEVLGGYLSGSLSLLADAGHMAVDSTAVALGLFALWIAKHPPTHDRTFGYLRMEILVALLNGAILAAVAFSVIWEAFGRFQTPHEIQSQWMFYVALGGLIVNIFGLVMLHGDHHESLNMTAVWFHLVADLLGSISALTASLLIQWKSWYWVDPLASLIIACLILYSSIRLLKDCVNVLLEATPRGLDTRKILKDLSGIPQVLGVHDLHVWSVNSGVIALSAHMRVKDPIQGELILKEASQILQDKYQIEHSTLQIETPQFQHASELECQKE